MKLSRTVSIAVATALCSAAAVSAAPSGGEPKNSAPFTRPATNGSTTHLASARTSTRGHRNALGCASGSATSRTTKHAPAVVSHSSRALQMVELGTMAAGSLAIPTTCGRTRVTEHVAPSRFQVSRDAL